VSASPLSLAVRQPNEQSDGPIIIDISDNRAEYAGSQVPSYKKLEITFAIEGTVAGNFQFPYDPNKPNGFDPTYPKHQGISVDAVFTAPDGQTYQQPAFYYQYFAEDSNDPDWQLPLNQYTWMVRFSPHMPGTWHYFLKVQDAGGSAQSQIRSFLVSPSSNKGFLRVSESDPRYFEFDSGDFFPGLGYAIHAFDNFPSDEVLHGFKDNGMQLFRYWLSQRNIFGSAWTPFWGINEDGSAQYGGYVPITGLSPFYNQPTDRTTITMRIDYEPEGNIGWFNGCRHYMLNPAVEPGKDYRVRAKYRGFNIEGPRQSGSDYGFVIKIGGWSNNCYEAGTSTPVTNYGKNNTDWGFVEGTWHSGSNNYLPHTHLALENATGKVYINSLSIQEDYGDGTYGPEIIHRPSMEHHLYFPQLTSLEIDRILEKAEEYDLYFKFVIQEKGDKVFAKIRDDGDFLGPGENDNWDGLYGDGRNLNKTLWLYRAYWRYLQARWGYSPHIHSWELFNEGNPGMASHYTLTDELGKFMHCSVFGVAVGIGDGDTCDYRGNSDHPNDHLVTTSFWHSLWAGFFSDNYSFPNVDYADWHAYVSTSEAPESEREKMQYDAAYYHHWHSQAAEDANIGKPVIRGEAGLDRFDSHGSFLPGFSDDTDAVWLHNYLWSGLDGGVPYELYWWQHIHIYIPGSMDHRPHYGTYYRFIKDIPLNNGNYVDAQAQASDSSLRAWGQKDQTNGRAHLWVQNAQHTWKNVVDGVAIPPVSGTVTIQGFQSGASYLIERWNTYTGQPDPIQPDANPYQSLDGSIQMQVNSLISDFAIEIVPAPAQCISPPAADVDGDCAVTLLDIRAVADRWTCREADSCYDDMYDMNLDGDIDIKDVMLTAIWLGWPQRKSN